MIICAGVRGADTERASHPLMLDVDRVATYTVAIPIT